MIAANSVYNGVVQSGSWMKSRKGTPGFELVILIAGEPHKYTLWVTEANRENVEAGFLSLGIKLENLANSEYRRVGLLQDVKNRQVTCGAEEQEYKGKTDVRIGWISSLERESDNEVATDVDDFFGGQRDGESDEGEGKEKTTDDDEVPF